MTLEGDIYLRYRCFKNKDEFRNALRTQRPIKIDLGAYYNVPVRESSIVRAIIDSPSNPHRVAINEKLGGCIRARREGVCDRYRSYRLRRRA